MKSGVRIAAGLSAWLILAGAWEPLVTAASGPASPLAPYYSVFPEVTLREQAGESHINIHREGDLRFASSVQYTTREMDWQRAAVAGRDFIPTSGTVFFREGETDQQIPIPLLDDTVAEPPKVFELLLTNATGRTSAWFTLAQLWIEDDDFNPLAIDPEFHTTVQCNGTSELGDDLKFSTLPDGSFIMPISLPKVAGGNAWGLARLSRNGAHDDTFASPIFNSRPPFALQPDGQVVVAAGEPFRIDAVEHSGIVRLRTDGSLDRTFAAPRLLATALEAQSDGRVLVATETSLLRLNAAGSPDASFKEAIIDWESPWNARIVLDSRGRVLIQPATGVNGTSAPGIARLSPGGSLDESFCRTVAGLGWVESLELSGEGALLVTHRDQGSSPLILSRLLDDGTPDPTFKSALPAVQYAGFRIIPARGERVMVIDPAYPTAAQFIRFVRLNRDGSLDDSFPAATYQSSFSFNWAVGRAVVNDALLIFGDGLKINGRLAPVRLELEPSPPRLDMGYDSAAVVETNGTKELTLIRTRRNLEELAVHWETTRDGTAQPGVDFVAAQGELFFASGHSEASITIELLDNHLLDGERDVVLALRTAAGPLPPVTFTIINDDLGFVSHESSKSGALMLEVTGNRAEPCGIETSENLRDWRRPRSVPFAGDIYDLPGSGGQLFYRLVR